MVRTRPENMITDLPGLQSIVKETKSTLQFFAIFFLMI